MDADYRGGCVVRNGGSGIVPGDSGRDKGMSKYDDMNLRTMNSRFRRYERNQRFEYLIRIATELRELSDAEEMELRELESEFCPPFGGCNHE